MNRQRGRPVFRGRCRIRGCLTISRLNWKNMASSITNFQLYQARLWKPPQSHVLGQCGVLWPYRSFGLSKGDATAIAAHPALSLKSIRRKGHACLHEKQHLTPNEQMEEEFLGLRKKTGVSLPLWKKIWPVLRGSFMARLSKVWRRRTSGSKKERPHPHDEKRPLFGRHGRRTLYYRIGVTMGLQYEEPFTIPFAMTDVKQEVIISQFISIVWACLAANRKVSVAVIWMFWAIWAHLGGDGLWTLHLPPPVCNERSALWLRRFHNKFFCYRKFYVYDEGWKPAHGYPQLLCPSLILRTGKWCQFQMIWLPSSVWKVKKIQRAPPLPSLGKSGKQGLPYPLFWHRYEWPCQQQQVPWNGCMMPEYDFFWPIGPATSSSGMSRKYHLVAWFPPRLSLNKLTSQHEIYSEGHIHAQAVSNGRSAMTDKEQWLEWGRLQSLAQNGFAYSRMSLTSSVLEEIARLQLKCWCPSGLPFGKSGGTFLQRIRLPDPKNRYYRPLFQGWEILLVQESDGFGSARRLVMSTSSVMDNTIKEVKEEAGLDVRAERLLLSGQGQE